MKAIEPAHTPTINFDAVPSYMRDDIAKSTLDAEKRFLAQPGGKEYLDKKSGRERMRCAW